MDRAAFDRAWDGVRDSQRTLERAVGDLEDDDARQPSRLPGWSIGHLLTHLARNAEGLTRLTEAVRRGEIGEMYPAGDYPDGQQRRDADIEAGASRPLEELVADIVDTGRLLDESVARLGDEHLDGYGMTRLSRRPIADIPLLRRREIEVHLVDLGRGYEPDDWPAEFVRTELRVQGMQWDARRGLGMTGLPAEALAAPPAQRLAWLFNRAALPGLPPADIYTM